MIGPLPAQACSLTARFLREYGLMYLLLPPLLAPPEAPAALLNLLNLPAQAVQGDSVGGML